MSSKEEAAFLSALIAGSWMTQEEYERVCLWLLDMNEWQLAVDANRVVRLLMDDADRN